MLQVNRNGNLKIPKKIVIYEHFMNSVNDIMAVKKSFATINHEKFDEKEELEKMDEETKFISKIPANSNDLIVITMAKKLCAYVILVTERSPKKFRNVFVSRMQNYCLDTLECLLKANFVRMDSEQNKLKRQEFQKEAIIQLKLLGYIAMIAELSGCILKKQHKQISLQVAEVINLVIAWKKSDDERWKRKK